MLLRSVCVAGLLTSAAFAQSGAFTLLQGDKVIGKDTWSLTKAKGGYKLSSHLSYRSGPNDSSFSNDFKYTDALVYVEGGSANNTTQAHMSFTPDKARRDLIIGVMQAGSMDSHHLPLKTDLTVLPDYDAGAAQAMVLLGVTHPSEKNLYSVFIPAAGSAGSAPGGNDPAAMAAQAQSGPVKGDFVYDALWQKSADATGMLEGKPVTLHSYSLTSGPNTWVFYADDANTLMQCNVSMLHGSYVRAKFQLDAAR